MQPIEKNNFIIDANVSDKTSAPGNGNRIDLE